MQTYLLSCNTASLMHQYKKNKGQRSLYRLSVALAIILFSSSALQPFQKKPTLCLIGDSTVKNGKGKVDGGLWGWGNYIDRSFDTKKSAYVMKRLAAPAAAPIKPWAYGIKYWTT